MRKMLSVVCVAISAIAVPANAAADGSAPAPSVQPKPETEQGMMIGFVMSLSDLEPAQVKQLCKDFHDDEEYRMRDWVQLRVLRGDPTPSSYHFIRIMGALMLNESIASACTAHGMPSVTKEQGRKLP